MTEARRIAITGASGSLGRQVLQLIDTWPGIEILALRRSGAPPMVLPQSVRCEQVDLHQRAALTATLAAFRPTAFIHCAAEGMQLPRPPWADLLALNVNVSLQLLELSARLPGCRFIHVSSGMAYREQGRPLREEDPLDSLHPYAATKATADMLLRAAAADLGASLTVVRPFPFSGPGDLGTRLFPALLRAAAQKRPLDLSPGDQVRDYCAAADVAEGMALILAQPPAPGPQTQIFNLGSGNARCLRSTIEDVVQALGLEVTLNFGARDYAPFEQKHLVADISQARSLLHWQPRTNLAYAIWQLARESFSSLQLRQPPKAL